ncbi:MAG: ABC transporter substrate-binding protein [Alphaproteobacteria bacterium]|nr:ABC transporter substrate-binding protein [Alphaproteobacteria bacterium]
MPYRRLRQVFYIVVATIFLALPARAESSEPIAVVEKLHDKLISVMRQAKELGYAGRRDALMPILLVSYDLPRMARVTVGRHWKEMDDGQKNALIEAFTAMTLSNYASRFNGFSGEYFETLGTLETPHGHMVVQTHIVTSDEKIRIDYLLRKSGNGWQIIDVFLKGTISELAARHSEYMTYVRDHGVDALIEAVQKKAASLAEMR